MTVAVALRIVNGVPVLVGAKWSESPVEAGSSAGQTDPDRPIVGLCCAKGEHGAARLTPVVMRGFGPADQLPCGSRDRAVVAAAGENPIAPVPPKRGCPSCGAGSRRSSGSGRFSL